MPTNKRKLQRGFLSRARARGARNNEARKRDTRRRNQFAEAAVHNQMKRLIILLSSLFAPRTPLL